MHNTLVEEFDRARKAGVPLLSIETQDQFDVVDRIKTFYPKLPIITWDIVSGWQAGTQEAREAMGLALGGKQPNMLGNPAEMLNYAKNLPKEAMLFIYNAHRYLGSENTSQAAFGQGIANLRNVYAANNRMLGLLGPGMRIPEELKQDILILDDPLPKQAELREIVGTIFNQNSIPLPTKKVLDKAAEILLGLSPFAAVQTTALAMSKTGIDLDRLWAKKRTTIEQVPGLKIWKGPEKYSDIEGVEEAKKFLRAICLGEEAPTVIVFMDEIEKALAGTQGDLSGVSQEMHGQLLSWMSDEEVMAMMMVGHPGCTKSFLSKAVGGEFGLPTILLNVSLLKGSLVGQSTKQMQAALKMISAIGRPLVMATSNDLDSLSPELKSRFELGTWFFDLPSKAEQIAVWNLYKNKFKLTSDIPRYELVTSWTPREIRACCLHARRLKIDMEQASKYIVPITRATPEKIERLRKLANNRFLSAAFPGVYKFTEEEFADATIRKLNISSAGEA